MAEHEETTLDLIRHLKRQDPFAPFRILMTSGDRYVIDDPDALAIATSQLHYYPRGRLGVHLRLNQIAAVEEAAA
jgi:pyridoxine/pyridoxamine 5'-phosphate oxidase